MKKADQRNESSQMLFETTDASLSFLVSWVSLLLMQLYRSQQKEGTTLTLARCVQGCLTRLQNNLGSDEHKALLELLSPSMQRLKRAMQYIIDNCETILLSQARDSLCKKIFSSLTVSDEFVESITAARKNIESEYAAIQECYNEFFLPANIYKFTEIIPIFSAVREFIFSKENHRVVRHGLKSHQITHIADAVKNGVYIDIMDPLARAIPELFKSVQAEIDNEDEVNISEEDREILLQDGILEIIYQAIAMDDPWSAPMKVVDAAYGCDISPRQVDYYVKKHPDSRRGSGQSFQFNTNHEIFKPLKYFDLSAPRSSKKTQKQQRKQS